MKEMDDMSDDKILIIGQDLKRRSIPRIVSIVVIAILAVFIIGGSMLSLISLSAPTPVDIEPSLFEPVVEPEPQPEPIHREWIGADVDPSYEGYTEIRDTLINDIPIRIYIPHNAEMSLHVGKMDRDDESVIYAAQAADVRADNGGIVGAFVLKGEPLSKGLSKKGYCASINGVVTVGVADNSPLFEQATEENGYFFRQYPLVSNGQLVENGPKGKSIRRAICDRQGEIFMVESGTKESFHDFAQALVDLGVDQSIYLVGSNAFGWAIDESGTVYEFGEDNYYTGRHKMPKNISYIIWRKK